jgi:uncharacterized protein with HEPN domain
MPRDEATLLDVAEAARLAVAFCQGLDKAGFLEDRKTQSAVLHQLAVMGEAVKRMSQGFKEAHPQMPWRLVAGMRDVVIHEYNDVDLDEVWRVVEKDLPELIQLLEPLLPRKD